MNMKHLILAALAAVAIPAQAALVKSPRLISGTSTQACWAEASNFDVVVKACNPDDDTQQVEATAGTAAGYYKLRFRSGRCAGVRSATLTAPAERVVTRVCSSELGDQFKLRRFTGSPNYKIQSRLGSLIVGTQSAPTSGLAVDMYTDESSTTQDWLLVEHVNKARPSDQAVRTTLGKAFNAKLSGSTVLPIAEVDLTDCDGLVCRVAGSNPARYAPAKAIVPGMVGADLVNSIAIEETSPPVTVTVATAAAISGTAEENQTITLTPATFGNYTGAVVGTLRRGSASGTVVATGVTSYTLTTADVGQSLYYVSAAGAVTSTANTATVAAAATGGSGWTGGIVTAAFSGLQNSGAIVATSGQVIQGKNISNPNGTCIVIPDGVTGVTIRGNNIGPCERVTLNNGDGAGMGVHVRGGSGHTVEGNYLHDMAIGVMVQGTGNTKIQRNRLHNIYGGNLAAGGSRYLPGIQFNAMTGASGRSLVACNVMDASTWSQTLTSTRPGIEDGFSTNGSSNVTYRHNYLRGSVAAGYNSPTGSCISLGDDSGNNNQARDNICVRTPNTGIFTAGGDNHVIESNKVYNVGTSGSNTMLSYSAGEFQGQSSSSVLMRNNVGTATQWKNGLIGSQDAAGSMWTWVAGRDATPNLTVDNLVLYGNNFRDTSLTEAGVWGTTYSACAGTAAIPSGDIAYPQVAQTIPLQSTITARTVPYPRLAATSLQGRTKFEMFNNNWTANSNKGSNTLNSNPGWSQSIGLDGLQFNHTINFRIKWAYPEQYSGQEVLNYPGIVEGRGATTSASTPQVGAKLPALVSSITSYRSGYASAAGPMSGLGHLTYDLWLSDSPSWTSTEPNGTKHRIAEIMKPTRIVGAYGIPNTPSGAAVGRNCTGLGTAATTCWGRNPSIWKGRYTIDGAPYDVYHALPGSAATGLAWNFVVFMPLTLPGTGPETTNWKPFLDFLNGQTWMTHPQTGAAVAVNNTYLNALELGVEAINPNSYDLATGGSTGDIQVMGFWTEFNGARY
jgi:hypothetical protein